MVLVTWHQRTSTVWKNLAKCCSSIKFQKILQIIFMGTNHKKVAADNFILESQRKTSKIKGTFSPVSQCKTITITILCSILALPSSIAQNQNADLGM